ncbi:hypothetical protein GCM10023156_23630 [Novipirellula rosea]|uniref:Uncharacterized protein n=1 Tax=Novipirellula rosea TaxID=1031540 RepID=A0ABP8MR60_9BACT
MKLRPRFTIATLLVVVMLAAFGLSVSRYFSASARYQRNGDVETLRLLLSSQLRRGDCINRVSSVLGSGRHDDGTHLTKLLEWKEGPHFKPIVIGPDGIEGGDQIVFYSADPQPSYQLQFRNGVLVNFDPKLYVGSDIPLSGLSQ